MYVCVCGGSYGDLDFDDREHLREQLRLKIESNGIRFLEYCWVWDEMDRCLLVTGTYEQMDDAKQWIESLERMGFHVILRNELPGTEQD